VQKKKEPHQYLKKDKTKEQKAGGAKKSHTKKSKKNQSASLF
jgi:hypothetical protein